VRENELEQPPTEFDTITGPLSKVGMVAILSPRPFEFVRDKLVVMGNAGSNDFAYYRLAYFQGLDPANIITIVDQVPQQRQNEPLGEWDIANLNGLYTLLLTVVRMDGSFEEAGVQVTIDNTLPTAEILFPLPNQTIFSDEEWVIVQAQVVDDVSVAQVSFFVDNAGVPFAISTVPPFTEKWTIPGAGCHSFKVKAVDSAGNETESAPVPVCIVAR